MEIAKQPVIRTGFLWVVNPRSAILYGLLLYRTACYSQACMVGLEMYPLQTWIRVTKSKQHNEFGIQMVDLNVWWKAWTWIHIGWASLFKFLIWKSFRILTVNASTLNWAQTQMVGCWVICSMKWVPVSFHAYMEDVNIKEWRENTYGGEQRD